MLSLSNEVAKEWRHCEHRDTHRVVSLATGSRNVLTTFHSFIKSLVVHHHCL